jgi:4-dimethylallyltryptophan N-methyltransferase
MDKVLLLLDALEEQKKYVTYYALDLSYSELALNLQAIPLDRFHYVRFAALHGTFDDGLHWLKNTPAVQRLPHCILLFGLTIGNYSRENAAGFLRNIAQSALSSLPAQSSIVVSLDSCKLPTKILRAYTADGVVPFALASLGYANSLFHPKGNGKVFNEEDWYFHSEWNYALGRHEASLITRSKDVQLGAPLQNVIVRRDEKVRFGCSYKYDGEEQRQLFCSAGLHNTAVWTTPDCDVAFYELKLAPN